MDASATDLSLRCVMCARVFTVFDPDWLDAEHGPQRVDLCSYHCLHTWRQAHDHGGYCCFKRQGRGGYVAIPPPVVPPLTFR